MAPNSSAVEIDPRLLRQLEEEYEALKNASSGASRFRDETRPSSRPRPHAEIASSLGTRADSAVSRTRVLLLLAGAPVDFAVWIKKRLK